MLQDLSTGSSGGFGGPIQDITHKGTQALGTELAASSSLRRLQMNRGRCMARPALLSVKDWGRIRA